MADNPYGLSAQDVQDLQQLAMHMPSDDPRRNKVNLLLNSAPTQFETDRAPAVAESQTVRNPWSEVGNFLGGAASSAVGEAKSMVKNLPAAAKGLTDPIGTGLHQAADIAFQDQQRVNRGASAPYRAAAAVGSVGGINVPGMEQAADVGNASKVAGIPIGDMAPAAIGEGVRLAPKVPFFLKNLKSSAVNGMDSFILGNDPAKTIVRATKPTVGLPEYEQSVQAALPELSRYNPQNLKQLVNAADEIKTTKNMDYQGLKANAGNAPVPTYSVASAQRESIPATNKFEDPNIVDKTNVKAARYQTTMPIEQADAIRMDTNAKLRDFYNKAGGDQAAALSNPETARTFAVNQGIRDELYSTIEQQTGVDPRPGQEMYGHAVDIGDTAGKRSTVFSRQQPNPLQEQLNMADALKDMSVKKAIASKLFKRYGNSDTMTQIAFDQYARQHGLNPTAVAPPAMAPNSAIPYFLLPLLANQRERK